MQKGIFAPKMFAIETIVDAYGMAGHTKWFIAIVATGIRTCWVIGEFMKLFKLLPFIGEPEFTLLEGMVGGTTASCHLT